MTTELQKTEYAILDKMDEDQIKSADAKLKQALVYEINISGKPVRQITFIGLKWLTVRMSQKGQSLEIISSEVKLEKDDLDKKDQWHWRAKVRVRNQKSGLETEGISECPYLETSGKGEHATAKYDKFGRTKAHSKAERNAWRKQIPELEIINLLKTAKGEEILKAGSGSTSDFCHCSPDKRHKNPTSTNCITCGKEISPIVLQELAKN